MFLARLRHPLFRASIELRRAPLYLRFVVKGNQSCARNWDALDQLDDAPGPDERVIVGRRERVGTVHVDAVVKGRRVGRWYQTAEYAPCNPQPADEVVRDNGQWREWALSRPAEEPPA